MTVGIRIETLGMRAAALLVVSLSACGGDGAPAGDAAGVPDGAVVDGAVTDAGPDGAPVPPTFATEFGVGDGLWTIRLQPEGSVDLDAISAQSVDGRVAMLVFPGDPARGPDELTSPAFATEIATVARLGFGTYRWRARLAACAPGEEVVNGLFVYAHDGGDANANGIEDNTEIDIEVLCGEPTVVWLTSWTDHQDSGGAELLRKRTRAVDLATGDLWETPPGAEGSYAIEPAGNLPEARAPGVSLVDGFTEMGFDWAPDRVRFFMVLGGTEVTLWDLGDASVIPQADAQLMFNLWHTPVHWISDGVADYPALDATMLVDWVRYWAL